MRGLAIDPAAHNVLAQGLGHPARLAVQGGVVGEEVAGQAVHQGRPGQALLDEQGIVVESGVQFPEPVRQTGPRRHPLQLPA
jgi:hypothetical protein